MTAARSVVKGNSNSAQLNSEPVTNNNKENGNDNNNNNNKYRTSTQISVRQNKQNSGNCSASHLQTRSVTPSASGSCSSSSASFSRVSSSCSSAVAVANNRRPASSCSFSNTNTNTNSNNNNNRKTETPLGQCRICRKFILANETCHLCSACKQFVCEDCGSYSASEQHWTCSSCRRRATKPAIPADALKELGLNQNSSAVRRMTLRLNQAELKLALSKGTANESNTSSTNSTLSTSGASSSASASSATAAMAVNNSDNCASVATGQAARSMKSDQWIINDQQVKFRPTAAERHQQQQQQNDLVSNKMATSSVASQQQQQPPDVQITEPMISAELKQQCDMKVQNSSRTLRNKDSELEDLDLVARKSLGQPAISRRKQQQQQVSPLSDIQQQVSLKRVDSQQQINYQAAQLSARLKHDQQLNHYEERSSTGSGSGRCFASGQQVQRKQSASYYPTQLNNNNNNNNQLRFHHQVNHQMVEYQQQQQPIMNQGNIMDPSSVPDPNQIFYHQQANYHTANHQENATAAAAAANNMSSRRSSSNTSGGGQLPVAQTTAVTLIPIPPDQIHLRRLSDQSNLVRRSSIIADALDGYGIGNIARNRSHSNIDSVSAAANYFYQSPLMMKPVVQPNPIELFQQHQNFNRQQIDNNYNQPTTMDFSNIVQNNIQQQQQQFPSDQSAAWLAYQQQYYQREQRSITSSSQQLSSIITPYAQKHHHHRRSSEDMRSDSSSDIEDDTTRAMQLADFDNENEQPNDYFAPPKATTKLSPSSSMINQFHNQQQLELTSNQSGQISIPSVSVSEFSSHNKVKQQNNGFSNNNINNQYPIDQIMTTPMQINSAIEQAIRKQQQEQQQQQQQQQQLRGAAGSQEFLSSSNMIGASGSRDFLLPRRGSGVRCLPKIPGAEQPQSRSLLDLPYSQQNGNCMSAAEQQNSSNLDLLAVSPTIRRASAPEGQNIKIVVDDIDGSMMRNCNGTVSVASKQSRMIYGPSKGEFYERLVLYRDDSIDPNTNMPRGFGLQVMGGKIDNDNKLQACISWILAAGPADKVGLKAGDKIIEWDGKCLVNMSYEQVADVIESSANIAELLVKPIRGVLDTYSTGSTNYVRSQRRLSQQTERDLKRNQPTNHQFDGGHFPQNGMRLRSEINKQQHHNQADVYRKLSQVGGFGTGTGGGQKHYQSSNGANLTGQCTTTTITTTPRTGTGRKLPQIPGNAASAAVGTLQTGNNSFQNKTDTSGKLILDSGRANGFMSYDQQSSSVSELYSAGRELAGQRVLPNSSALFGRSMQSGGELRQTSSILGVQNDPFNNGNSYMGTSGNRHQAGYLNVQDEVCGLIGLQVSVDERVGQLEISILNAISIERNPALDYYVRVKILPESNRFKACTTQPSCDMNWKETFIFQNFPTQQIQRMALEIGIWVYDEAPRLSAQIAQPICETLISIQSARERNTDFWPLRPPPTSPQARRKSLNDLIESYSRQESMFPNEKLYEPAGNQFQARSWQSKQSEQQLYFSPTVGRLKVQAYDSVGYSSRDHLINKERSSSARNLPTDTYGSQRTQPRRASDEVAGSSTHRLSARVSPAASRRSISVMNVGDGHTLFTRPSSRLGSQSNILKCRRDSSKQHSAAGSPNSGRYASPGGSVTRIDDPQLIPLLQQQQQQQVGVTPSGRRSSLVGIQSMRGYRSQKNSQSGSTTDQESPMRGVGSSSAGGGGCGNSRRVQSATSGTAAKSSGSDNKRQANNRQVQQHRGSVTTSSHSGSPVISANCSRRGSIEQQQQQQQQANQLQRKGSFAMQTLRKLKRTMSLNKGNGANEQAENEDSRRSSSSSELGEDVGLSRRLAAHIGSVGKLKLSFVMTKGQLEVEVICAQELKFDQELTLGIYVKMYLKGKGKSNKRKTRIVHPNEAPVFRQLIKYDGSLVDNKTLEVSVWHKQAGLRGKAPIGFTEIQLNELMLEQIQTSWYNLHPMDVVCSSSFDE